ncbi:MULTISPECIES: hypothetical protein [unclassified Streptomyces]|uniref:hypothetical protein n=1 Tax=unclassified Streptomyces TaxID=2593676 RepID=UPI0033EB33CB
MVQLNQRQARVLSDEICAVSSLVRHGIRIVEGYRMADYDAEPAIVCLAGGAEKLLKLTLGLNELGSRGTWLEEKRMRSFGHKIDALDEHIRKMVEARIEQHHSVAHLRQVLNRVDANPYVKPILQTLTTYANQGRYYNLDTLARGSLTDQSPAELWEELHEKILDANPGILRKIAELNDEGRKGLNEEIKNAFCVWVEYLAQFWRIGFFGREAQRWASQLDLHAIAGREHHVT